MRTLQIIAGLFLLATLGCSSSEPDITWAFPLPQNTISPSGVGNYVIGTSTLAEILGEDSLEARSRFAEKGLAFQFDQGVTLTGITISSEMYRFKNALAVGSSADDVRTIYGEPLKTKIENHKLSLDALVYENFTFYLHNETVSAIFIHGK